jgi:hypothetical protein
VVTDLHGKGIPNVIISVEGVNHDIRTGNWMCRNCLLVRNSQFLEVCLLGLQSQVRGQKHLTQSWIHVSFLQLSERPLTVRFLTYLVSSLSLPWGGLKQTAAVGVSEKLRIQLCSVVTYACSLAPHQAWWGPERESGRPSLQEKLFHLTEELRGRVGVQSPKEAAAGGGWSWGWGCVLSASPESLQFFC